MVEPAQMMERDADLQDALVQAAHVTRLGAPQQFERLVLLEIVAAVELLDPFEQRHRRGLAARSAHGSDPVYLSSDAEEAAIEDSWLGRLHDADDHEEHAHHRLRR